jgi:hypothetical protein
MRRLVLFAWCAAAALCVGNSWQAFGQNEPMNRSGAEVPRKGTAQGQGTEAVTPPGDPVLEEPTLHCLGAYWIVAGDEKKEWRIEMEYRKVGDAEKAGADSYVRPPWIKSMPMFRVRKGDTTQVTHDAQLNPAADAWLFAGSIVNLTPGTEYELKLKLVKPDGAATEKILKGSTRSEPVDPEKPKKVYHVVPGKGGGEGTEADPFKGLEYAETDAEPGTIFLVHKGVYDGTFHVLRSGEPGQPVIWRAAGDGEAVIDGGGTAKFGIEVTRVHDVRFEKLTIRGFYMGISVLDSSDLVIRRCSISDVKCGIYCGSSRGKTLLRNILICDNRLEGPFKWGEGRPGAGNEEWRGIQLTGLGHDICYNFIRNFKDGIDTFPSKYCAAIDIHHNEIMNCQDDGVEMDFSERNCRCFLNRITNVHQGISEQPIYGGPVYIFRNVLYNVGVEPFKLHHNGGPGAKIDWWPSGAIMYHNTIVKKGEPCILYTSAPVYNCVYRNNLFIGGGKRAFDFDPPMNDCDFDYDGFGGGPWEQIFMKWNTVRYQTFDEMKAKAPIEKHAVLVDAATAFAGGILAPPATETEYDPAKNDARLKEGCAGVDAGEVLPGFNDGFAGKAPDLGAYELGAELPQYGPRPEK